MKQMAEQHALAHDTCRPTSGTSDSEHYFLVFGDLLKMHIAHYRWRQPLLLAYCQGKATLNPEEEEACTDTIQSAKANLPRAKFLNAWARAEVAEITPTSQNS